MRSTGSNVEVSDPDGQQISITPNNDLETVQMNTLVTDPYDYMGLTYSGTNLTQVVYKTGGSGGTTVATVALTYDGSDKLTSVTKS